MQPLTKTETYTGLQGRKPEAIVIAAPGMGPKVSELQTKFLVRPRETETRALLSNDRRVLGTWSATEKEIV